MYDPAVFSEPPTLVHATVHEWVTSQVEKPAIVLWGVFQIRKACTCGVRTWADLSTENGDQIDDNRKANRRLRVRRLLTCVILMNGYKGSIDFVIIPQGFRTFVTYPSRTEFCFDPEVVDPFVDWTFDCVGTMSEYTIGSINHVKFMFRDAQQMNQFFHLNANQPCGVQNPPV